MNMEFDIEPVYASAFVFIPFLFIVTNTFASNLHLHLQVLCHSICLVSLVLDIRLNTLTFMFLIVSGTYDLAYGSLTVLQVP